MRILFLTQWFQPENFFKDLPFARGFAARGHDLEVLTGFPKRPLLKKAIIPSAIKFGEYFLKNTDYENQNFRYGQLLLAITSPFYFHIQHDSSRIFGFPVYWMYAALGYAVFNWWRVMSSPFDNRPDSPRTCRVREVEVASSYALLVPIRTFVEAGMMDETYFLHYDDPDFVLRAGKAGYGIYCNPNSVIYNREKASTGGQQYSATGLYSVFRNRPYMMRKLLGKGWRYWRFVFLYIMEWGLKCLRFRIIGCKDLVKSMTKAIHDFNDGRMGQAPEKNIDTTKEIHFL